MLQHGGQDRFNRTGCTQNRPRPGRPKKLSAPAQLQGSRFFIIRHIHNHTSIISSEMQVELKKIQRLCLGSSRMSADSIAAEVEGVGVQPVSAQTIRRTLHQICLHGCRPRMTPLLKMMHKKACK